MDTLAQKNQTFEPIRHTFHIVYVTAVATSWTVFQKAKKTSGRGTSTLTNMTSQVNHGFLTILFLLGKWPLKPLLGIVCALLSDLKGVFITNFSVPSCSKLRRKQRHVWNAHWTMHRGKWTLLILQHLLCLLQNSQKSFLKLQLWEKNYKKDCQWTLWGPVDFVKIPYVNQMNWACLPNFYL